MTDWAASATDIHRAFADPILYTGAGLVGGAITATKFDTSAAGFQGAGDSARRIWFEVPKVDLPAEPGRGNLIVHPDPMTGVTTNWRVIDRVSRDDIAAWELTVEKA